MSEYQDKVAIIEIVNLYAFALDSHRWDLFDQVFTQDTLADYGGEGATWTSCAELVSVFDVIHSALDSHQHTMMGHLVHVAGDTAYAFTYGNWLLVRYGAEGGSTWRGTGWYDDELVRTDQGWRIKHRISRIVSDSGNRRIPQLPESVDDRTPDPFVHVLFDEVSEIRYFAAIDAKQA